jgi:hypothetical protein
MPLKEWIRSAGLIVGGRPLSFEGFEFQRTIAEDEHPIQVVMKSAQVGASEIMTIRSLYTADHLGLTTLYYLDTDDKAKAFGKSRIQGLINRSPALRDRVGETWSATQIDIGAGTVHVFGMFSESHVITTAGDYVIRDEIDRSKQDHAEFALDRIMASRLQWSHALSQPSFPGYGIHKLFMQSDQRYWMIKCGACGAWHSLERQWPENFIPVPRNGRRSFPAGATHYRGCTKCGARLNMKQGEWAALHPDRSTRGYHISQLYSQIAPPKEKAPNKASELMAEFELARTDQRKMKRFIISVVGNPYGGDDARITEQVLDEARGQHGFSRRAFYSFMGVDVGDVLHIAIAVRSDTRLLWIHFESTRKWNRLHEIRRRFVPAASVIDAMPYKRSAMEFALTDRRRTWIQYFKPVTELERKSELFEGRIPIQVIHVDRTESLDGLVDGLVYGESLLPEMSMLSPAEKAVMGTVRDHLQMLVTEKRTDAHGNVRRVYLDKVENHYAMAMNSARIGALRLGVTPPPTGIPPVFLNWKGGAA